ncbi:caspase-8-like isoform X1 [Branchiostoma lanceolatum]|uniref:caspase-8-like isoform X1 n=2 Tax=Branchiostoma lanceolatum TaxID=7740 RepID=UPI0034549F32
MKDSILHKNKKESKMAGLPSTGLATDAVDPNFTFRRALKDIDDDLTSGDIASLKFLCRDFIPAAKLENAKGSLDVFRHLENKGLLGQNNLMFLTELLYRIQRADLLRKLSWRPEQVSREIGRGRALLNPFRVMLLEVSEELTNRDFDDMKFMAAAYISRNKLETVDSFLSLAIALEQGMHLSSDNVQVLHELLQTHERPDLKNIVQNYEASTPSRSGGGKGSPDEGFPPSPMKGDSTPQHRPLDPQTQQQNPAYQEANLVAMTQNMMGPPQQGYQQMIQTELMQQAGRVSDSQARQTARVADQQPPDPAQEVPAGLGPAPADLQAIIQRELELKLEQERARQREEMPCYGMEHNPRGLAVIVNNKQFFHDHRNPNSKQRLENREGTNVDRDNLNYIFDKLGFEVTLQEDLTHDQLINLFTEVRRADHRNYDCFVACILSHGSQGQVYGSDSVPVSIRDLAEEIKSTKCPSLSGKPKLFFIQACQGRSEQRGISDIRTDASDGLEAFQETIPNEADFLLSYSTIPGYVSYRSKTQGSWFVTKLVETLDNMGNRHDLLSILIKVNEEVGKAIARKGGGQFKQSPAPVATLRKKIFFSFLREGRKPQVIPGVAATNTAV